jgi:hypothetical protein
VHFFLGKFLFLGFVHVYAANVAAAASNASAILVIVWRSRFGCELLPWDMNRWVLEKESK